MMRTCLINEIGHGAFCLLVVIGQTEDSARYRRPITWYDDQLFPVAGFTNRFALARARSSAVKSGWLHYEHGGKGKPGKYWLTIPDHALGIEDSEIGFVREHYPPASTATESCTTACTESAPETHSNHTECDIESAPETHSKRFPLIPNPNPIPDPLPHESEPEVSQLEKVIEAMADRLTMPSGESAEFREWYKHFPNPGKRGAVWKAYQNAVIAVMRDSLAESQSMTAEQAHALLLEAVKKYQASPVGSTPPKSAESRDYRQEPHRWLESKCWTDPPEKWITGANVDSSRSPPVSGHARSKLDEHLDSHGL